MNYELATIAHQVSDDTGISFATVNVVSKRIFAKIRHILEQQQPVDIDGFGRFAFHPRKERINTDVTNPTGPKTYTPACTVLRFHPEPHWLSWQRFHSAIIPDSIPDGLTLSADFLRNAHIRQQLDDPAPMSDLLTPTSLSFYQDVIVARAKKKEEQDKE